MDQGWAVHYHDSVTEHASSSAETAHICSCPKRTNNAIMALERAVLRGQLVLHILVRHVANSV
jgi:hypothetical protein